MEKIMIAMDNGLIHENTVRFACYLAKLTNSGLTGIFLEDMVISDTVFVQESAGQVTIRESVILDDPSDDMDEQLEENMDVFDVITRQEGVEAVMDLEEGIPAVELLDKTRFADLLVLDARTSFSAYYEGAPTRFVRDMLKDVECPVVIAPEQFSGIDNILFCYHRSKSFVFAIKQFLYLFPTLKGKHAKIVFINEQDKPDQEEQDALTDWLKCHFADVEILILDGESRRAFFTYLLTKKTDFLVMGAYGRGLLNSFFESDEQQAHTTTSLPIFIAHY